MWRERTRGRTPALVCVAAASAFAVTLAAVLPACGDTARTRPTPPPVRIGAIYNLTGEQSSLDSPSLDGARLAVDRINANGGLLGRRVELLERDGQTNAYDVRLAAESLVAVGVSAIIGLSDTDHVLAAAPVAARAGVPFMTSGATSPRLTQKVPDWLFLACFGDNAQAAADAQFATDQLGARSAAILYDKDAPYARLLARYFARSFRAQGGTIVAAADFRQPEQAAGRLAGQGRGSSSDSGSGSGSGSSSNGGTGSSSESAGGSGLSSAAGVGAQSGGGSSALETSAATTSGASGAARSKAPAASADVVFVAALPDEAPEIVRLLRAAGYDRPIMGGDSFDTSRLVAAAQKSGGKVYFTTHAAVGLSSASRAVRRFDAFYLAAYGRPPQNAFASLGYDAIDLVAAAIKRAKSSRPGEVRDALLDTRHFPGVSGTLSYRGEDGVPHKKITVVCVGRRPVVAAQFVPRYVPSP